MSSDTQPPAVHDDTDKADTTGGGGANQQPTPPVTSDTLKAGDAISDELLARLAKLEKYEHKLAEVARVYRNLNGARKSIEVVLKKLTPVQSIADVDELEEYLSNLNMKAQYAGEQIGALTEQDKTNRGKITELERQVSRLATADDERQRAVRDLETSLRERKVSEGQLERANQKLRLDIGALEAKLAERDGEKKASQAQTVDAADADSLASRLTGLISSDSDGGTLGEESMAALRKTIIGKWGPPEGFVSAGELETSARALESCRQEVVQVKDIMRKELDASEERIKQVSEEKDGRIRELAEQLESATFATAAATACGSGSDNGGLSAERVTSIINAAVAGKLAGSSKSVATDSASDTPPLPTATATATAAVGAAGKKKGNKKKRRGTQSVTPSESPSPSPASVAAKATSGDDDAADSSMVEVSRSEIARLVELIESAGNREGGSGSKATELLETQLAEARKAAEEAQREIKEENSKVNKLRADVAQLEARIGEAEALRDKLREEKEGSEKERARVEGQLDEQAKQIKELEEQLDEKATRIKSLEAQLATANKELSECRARLGAAEEAASGHNEERTQLAQSLAKTQGANARLEARQRELQTQADKMTSECEEQRKRVSSMQETLAKLEEEHAKTLAT
ncbi:hypothetical protein GGI11_007469, partial [Coemansia sp. RSA 2049]